MITGSLTLNGLDDEDMQLIFEMRAKTPLLFNPSGTTIRIAGSAGILSLPVARFGDQFCTDSPGNSALHFCHHRQRPCARRRWQRDWSRSRLRNQGSAQWPIFFLFFQVLRSIPMQPERWAKRLIARAIPFMTLANPI